MKRKIATLGETDITVHPAAGILLLLGLLTRWRALLICTYASILLHETAHAAVSALRAAVVHAAAPRAAMHHERRAPIRAEPPNRAPARTTAATATGKHPRSNRASKKGVATSRALFSWAFRSRSVDSHAANR